MTEREAEEVIRKWKMGQSKFIVAEDYQREQNKKQKDINVKMSKQQALQEVEKVIYKEVLSWNK